MQNKLLASLPPQDYQRLAPHLRREPMDVSQVVHRQDERIQDVYFPNGGAFSLVKTMQDGQVAEVATIGNEGAIGASVAFGEHIAECEVMVQVPVPSADILSAEVFDTEMKRRAALFNCVVRYNQALLSQIMQTTVCNSLHSVEQRSCRWLLMTHDRAGTDEFSLRPEFLAMMLGVRRPTVTLIAHKLFKAGLIRYQHASITIVDRAGLEAASCECYGTVRNTWRRLLSDTESRGANNE